jgi:hypothetical protein
MNNTIISKFLAENAAYIDENSAVSLSSLDDAAWPALVAAVGELHPGATEPGVDCYVAVTHETLDDFQSSRDNHWRVRGVRSDHVVAGYRAVKYGRFQLQRGDQRRTQIVVDLGDIRVALV